MINRSKFIEKCVIEGFNFNGGYDESDGAAEVAAGMVECYKVANWFNQHPGVRKKIEKYTDRITEDDIVESFEGIRGGKHWIVQTPGEYGKLFGHMWIYIDDTPAGSGIYSWKDIVDTQIGPEGLDEVCRYMHDNWESLNISRNLIAYAITDGHPGIVCAERLPVEIGDGCRMCKYMFVNVKPMQACLTESFDFNAGSDIDSDEAEAIKTAQNMMKSISADVIYGFCGKYFKTQNNGDVRDLMVSFEPFVDSEGKAHHTCVIPEDVKMNLDYFTFCRTLTAKNTSYGWNDPLVKLAGDVLTNSDEFGGSTPQDISSVYFCWNKKVLMFYGKYHGLDRRVYLIGVDPIW